MLLKSSSWKPFRDKFKRDSEWLKNVTTKSIADLKRCGCEGLWNPFWAAQSMSCAKTLPSTLNSSSRARGFLPSYNSTTSHGKLLGPNLLFDIFSTFNATQLRMLLLIRTIWLFDKSISLKDPHKCWITNVGMPPDKLRFWATKRCSTGFPSSPALCIDAIVNKERGNVAMALLRTSSVLSIVHLPIKGLIREIPFPVATISTMLSYAHSLSPKMPLWNVYFGNAPSHNSGPSSNEHLALIDTIDATVAMSWTSVKSPTMQNPKYTTASRFFASLSQKQVLYQRPGLGVCIGVRPVCRTDRPPICWTVTSRPSDRMRIITQNTGHAKVPVAINGLEYKSTAPRKYTFSPKYPASITVSIVNIAPL